MQCYSSGSSEVHISPTFLSSDLLTPGVPRRSTFSSLGVFRRPNNVTGWGTEDTKYGGVGKLPVLPQSNAVTGDIVRSRSHQHYSSGVHNYDASSQSYAVTSLSLSACRINDQQLPTSLNTEHDKLDEPWPGHAYTSHICQFDVFPRFDPERTDLDVPCGRKLKQELSPATKDALDQLSHKIYRTSVYQDSMTETGPNPVQEQKDLVYKLMRLTRGGSDSSALENWEVNDEEEIAGKESSDDEGEKTEENQESRKCLKNGKIFDDKDTESDSKRSAAWPIWPVGLNNMRKAPLNFPKIPMPTYTALDLARRNGLQDEDITGNTKRVTEKYSLQNSDCATKTKDENRIRITSKYIPALTAYKSNTLELGESKHLKFTHPEVKTCEEVGCLRVGLVPVKNIAGADYVRLPPVIPQEKTMQSKTLGTTKHCATGMLGVRFKSEAHRRYRQIYSDVIPDLRDSTITGRQHFFWGVHACALR